MFMTRKAGHGWHEGLTFDRLETFLAIAENEHLSLAEVAKGDAARQSQMSRQLAELGAGLKLKLFTGQKRGRKLSPQGIELRRLLTDLKTGIEALRGPGQGDPDRVRVAAGDSVLQWLVLPRTRDLRLERATLGFEAAGEPLRTLLEGGCDVAITRKTRAWPAQVHVAPRPICRVEYALFMPRTLERTLQHGDPNDLSRLAGTPFVEVTTASGRALAMARKAIGPNLRIGLRCETFPQAAQAVATGGYLAVLPAIAAASLQGLAAVRPIAGGAEEPLYLVTRKAVHDSRPAVAETFGALLQAIAPLRR